MGAINRRVVLGWLGLLFSCSQVMADAPASYSLRYWKDPLGVVLFSVAGVTDSDLVERFYDRMNFFRDIPRVSARYAMCYCPNWNFSQDPYNNTLHFVSDVGGTYNCAAVSDDGKYWTCVTGIETELGIKRAALANGVISCCSKCDGYNPSNGTAGHNFAPYTRVVNNSDIPFWAFNPNNPIIGNTSLILGPEGNPVGVDVDFDLPDGGVDGVNGTITFPEGGGDPYWVPSGSGGSSTNAPEGELDLTGLIEALEPLASVTAALNENSDRILNLIDLSAGWNSTLSGQLVDMNSGLGIVEALIGQHTGVVHADLLQLNASVLSLAGSGSGGTGTTYNDAGLRSDLAGFRADVNGHWESLGDNVRVWVHDAVGASVEAAKAQDEVFYQYVRDRDNELNSAASGVTFEDFQSVPLAPFEAFTETPVVADEQGMFDSQFSSSVGTISEFGAVFDSWRLNVTTLGNNLVGNWSGLGQEPFPNWSMPCGLYGSKTVDMSTFNNWWRIVRGVEVIAVWLLFLWAIMRLLKDAVA